MELLPLQLSPWDPGPIWSLAHHLLQSLSTTPAVLQFGCADCDCCALPLLQVQMTIGLSDYVRRDMALKNLIQPLAGEYGMHNNEPQGEHQLVAGKMCCCFGSRAPALLHCFPLPSCSNSADVATSGCCPDPSPPLPSFCQMFV